MEFRNEIDCSRTWTRTSDETSTPQTPMSKTTTADKASYSPRKQQKSQHSVIIWPVIALCVPMALISALLLTVVFKYRVDSGLNLFQNSNASSQETDNSYILVNFSSTRMVFLADLTSTVAPLLVGSLMSLASVILLRRLRQTHNQADPSALPTPHQVSLLIGTIAASYEHLWKSFKYLSSRKRKTPAPPVLWYAVTVLSLTIILGIALTVADAIFHNSATTASVTLYSTSNEPLREYGRGLNALCANFDRMETNFGFPCTTQGSTTFVDPDFAAERAEAQYLAHNTSQTMEIRFTSLPNSENASLAYLITKPSVVGLQTDFRATTIGVAAQCNLIPQNKCNATKWGQVFTSFNCSNNFHGVLGLPPNISSVLIGRRPSPDISFLAMKPSSNLQYAFFSDANLEDVYNPAGLNDSAMADPTIAPLTDAQLSNVIHLAFAWRSTPGSFLNGSKNEMSLSNDTIHYPTFLDYFLKCQLQAYDVEYVWANGSLLVLSASLTVNGTFLNMWQGANRYITTVTDSGIVFQDINAQASFTGTTIESYSASYGALLSQQILSTIGGYTSPRQVLQQQNRRNQILTKISKLALGMLIGCSLVYPTLALLFVFKAYRIAHEHTLMAPLLSNWGLASTAWNENEYNRRSTLITAEAIEACEKEEKVRVYITNTPSNEFRFAVCTQQSRQGEKTAVAPSTTLEDIGIAV